MQTATISPRILRLPELQALVGLSRATIAREVKRGSFPAPRRIARRRVGWLSSDVDNWLASRLEATALGAEVRA